jgi:hypothetical protein
MMAFIGLSDWEKFILLRCWIRLKALVGAPEITPIPEIPGSRLI